jgi:membrane protease YdiL (CAAX protease family)
MFTLSEFLNFLRNPHYPVSERKTTPILKTTLKIYLLSILFIGLVNFINITILNAFLTLPIDETFDIPDRLKNHLWFYFLIIAIFSPVIEEIIFRLSLIFSPRNIALSVSVMIALIIKKFSNLFISGISFALLFILIYRLTTFYKLNLISFWSRNIKYIFYFLAISFGLLHMANYKYSEISQYIIGPILVFPQLAIGFILSFTRLYYKKGFQIGILTHVIMNMLTISLFLHSYSHSLGK